MEYRRTFIQSPVSDSVFLLGCPLLVLGGLLLALQFRWLTLEAFIGLSVVYTGAHHLPGFLRAYGTREVFSANRGRLILAPVLIFATLLFLELRGLRGYIVVLWFFNWWHTAMQNYGLLRVYERKVLPAAPYSVTLDFVTLLVWHFTASELLPDDIRFDLSQHLFNLSITDPSAVSNLLWGLRWLGLAASAVLLVLYVRNSVRQYRENAAVAINKQIFLFGTYALYFVMFTQFTKDVSTSVESFFHNTQYLFFAWIMQRRLAERSTESPFNAAGALFNLRSGAVAAVVYLGLVAGYGYLIGGSIKPRVHSSLAVPLFNVLYATMAFLHYYTDSFIWKARSREMSQALDLAGGAGVTASPRSLRYSLAELSWMMLLPIAIAVALTNPANRAHAAVRDNPALAGFGARLLARRAEWPGAAVAAADIGDSLAATDTPDRSIEWYRRAVAVRPDYADAWQALGHVYSREGRLDEAVDAYERAVALDRTFTASWNNLGNAYFQLGRLEAAERAYEAALAVDGHSFDTHINFGTLLLQTQRAASAEPHFRQAVSLDSASVEARLRLGQALLALGRLDEASAEFAEVQRLAPNEPVGFVGQGEVALARGDSTAAAAEFQKALRIDPNHPDALAGIKRLQPEP